MKKRMLFKAVAAMMAAFVVLNLFCIFYYNLPIHSYSETGSTDYVWGENKFYSRGTEGFASGTIDENGFNNLRTFENGEIDVLVMGSSHMEAFNVAKDKNTTARLNEMFQNAGLSLDAYNIGISGHPLIKCLNNLENAIDEFSPKEYVVIEAQSIALDSASMKKVLDGTLQPTEAHAGGIIGTLQRIPYLRLMYSQIKNAQSADEAENDVAEKKEVVKNTDAENERNRLLDELLSRTSEICDTAGVKLIIFYNYKIDFDEQGQIVEQNNIEGIERFKTVCEKNNIIFVNMYDSFKANYYKTSKLPRGFSNTNVGEGHLNEEGHRVIAETLFSVIANN